jgi:uncharacterized protein (DUF1684 family)
MRGTARTARRAIGRRGDARLASPAIALIALAIVAGCTEPQPEGASYAVTLAAARADKDRYFRESPESPIPPARRDAMLPLSYFPPDPSYRTTAVLAPAEDQSLVIQVPTSTGKMRAMRRVGALEFTLRDRRLKLTAFVEADGSSGRRLFVPFTDLTTGTETYAAGRYLDLDRTATGIYEIDFNRAYHPFCYFDERFDCPYPPRENRLPLPIRAGERLPPSASGTPAPSRD